MAEFMLDFEKPIYELEAKLAEWEKLDAEQSMNFSDELKMLRKKIEETKKEVYRWADPHIYNMIKGFRN